MDTVRTNKSKKRNWLIAGSLFAVLFLVFVVVCVAYFGGDSTEEVVEDKGVTVKTVPEAFEYIEGKVEKELASSEDVKNEVLESLKLTKEKTSLAMEMNKAAESTEKTTGGQVQIKITDESTEKDRSASAPPTVDLQNPGSGPTTTHESSGTGDDEETPSGPAALEDENPDAPVQKPEDTVTEPAPDATGSESKPDETTGIVIKATIPLPSKKGTPVPGTPAHPASLQGATH